MTIILEIKIELKEFKGSRHNSSRSSNPKRSNNTKLIASSKYCWTYGYNSLYHSKECRFPADNYQPKATIDNTIGERT